MKNPFIYGEVVTGKDFADREVELENIIRDLKDGQNIFLISPRRYGKTSLIINALEKLQLEGFYTAYIDLFKVSSFKAFLEDKFSETGFSLEEGVVDEILNVTENYPYNVQFLCHELWNNCLDSRRATIDDITSTMNKK